MEASAKHAQLVEDSSSIILIELAMLSLHTVAVEKLLGHTRASSTALPQVWVHLRSIEETLIDERILVTKYLEYTDRI